jgi:hypothetical protein
MVSRVRIKKHHGALKHGGYSATGLLPGEDPAEFEKLHKDLVDEYAPDGPLERDVVFTMARQLWRKQNLSTFRTAELVRTRCNQIINEEIARLNLPDLFPLLLPLSPEQEEAEGARAEARRVGEEKARNELGELYELTHEASMDRLMAELGIEERQSTSASSGC